MSQQQLHTQPSESGAYTLLPLPGTALPGATTDVTQAAAGAEMAASSVEENADVENVQEKRTADNQTLSILLQKEARQRTNDAWRTGVYMLLFMLPIVQLLHLPSGGANTNAYMTSMQFFAVYTCVLTTFMLAHLTRRSYRRKRSLTQELAKTHDVGMVTSLVETLRVDNTQVRNLTKHALTGLLPQLRASDGELLGEKQRDVLLRQLAISPADKGYRDLGELFSRAAYQRELQFRLSILKSLEQVGGAKELPIVERLSRGLPNLQSGTRVPKEVREAAKECLPSLQERALGQRASEQLLRASSAQDTATDVLLRPASGQPDALPDQLLRASEDGAA